MAIISRAKGNISIVDLTDSRQIIAYIASSNQRQVIYNPNDNTYSPDYSKVNNRLEPELYVAGSDTNKINEAKTVIWSVQTNSVGAFAPIVDGTTYALGSDHTLTIKKNVLEAGSSMTYKVTITYTDGVSGRDILIQSDFEIVKLTNGASGEGENAVVAVLTNDSQTIPTDSEGGSGNFSEVESSINVYEGVEDVTADWSITFLPSTGVLGGIVSDSPDLYDEKLATANYLDEAGKPVPPLEDSKLSTFIGINPSRSYEYKQKYINKMTWSDPAFYYWAFYDVNKVLISTRTIDDSEFLQPNGTKTITHIINSTDIPSNASFIRIGGNFQVEGATFRLIASGANAYRVTSMSADTGDVLFTATKLNKTLTKRFTLTKAKAGKSSYLWVRYAQDAKGTGMTTSPINAVYIGTTTTSTTTPPQDPLVYQWMLFKGKDGIPGASGYLHIRYSNDGGLTFTANNGETEGEWMGTYTDSIEADSSEVSRYTWVKVKGADSTSYTLITSPTVIKKSADGVLNPTTIVATAKSQTGTKAIVGYKGRFTIESDTGSGYTLAYTSSLDESTKTYSVPTGAIQTRVRLYQAGGTNTLLDEQTIATVTDGADGTVLIINTPKGTTIRNGEGTLTTVASMYKGSKEVTGSTYQWYELDPSGTGDIDSGAGWNKLSGTYTGGTSGYFTKTLSIPADAFLDTATYMAIVTYGGMKYKQQITVDDITDPYDVRVLGDGLFKNAQGTNTYTAKVFQSGAEVDANGSLYTYTWNVYKSTGDKDASFNKVGKTITLAATEYDGKGELRCTVTD